MRLMEWHSGGSVAGTDVLKLRGRNSIRVMSPKYVASEPYRRGSRHYGD